MGLARHEIAFLVMTRRLGVNFDHTLMLGRQGILVDHGGLRAGFSDGGVHISRADAQRFIRDSGGYAEAALGHLGATRVDSIDASDYEQSTFVHDLNDPLPEHLRERYSVVLDGGTLEHVFNYPAALGNALAAIRPGGHFIAMSPMSGYTGHGFYQFSPELFYTVLGPANGFRIVCMLMKDQHWAARWREVPDPAAVGGRVLWSGGWPALLYVVAERLEVATPMFADVTQSDYRVTWHQGAPGEARFSPSRKHWLRAKLPPAIEEMRRSLFVWRRRRGNLPVVHLSDVVDAGK